MSTPTACTTEQNDGTALSGESAARSPREGKVALLTNILLPYRVALLSVLATKLGHLRIFLSAKTEPDRKDRIAWGKLDVVVQASIGFTHTFRHVHEYQDASHIHLPYDTLWVLRRFRPQVVVSGEFGFRTLMALVYCLLSPKTGLIVWATVSKRTEATRGGMRVRLRKLILSHVHAVFANGIDAEEYVRSLGYRGRVFHIPYVVDNAFFSGPTRLTAKSPMDLFFSGQLIERKGILPFYTALAKWASEHPERSLHLRIAGDGPQRDQLATMPVPTTLRLSFLGYLTQEQLAREYHRSSIYVFPTLADEWGVVVNESLAAGVPVLGSVHSQAVEELIRDGENGWKFDPTVSGSIRAALDNALGTTPEQLMVMSENARRSISALTPDSISTRMADAIAWVADVARRTRA